MGAYRKLTAFFGATRGLFLPFGLAAVMALGVHLGSDAAQNGTFWVLELVDSASEAVVEFFLSLIGATGIPDADWVARQSWAFAAWIDFDVLEGWASGIALVLEILIDLLLLRIALGYDELPLPFVAVHPDHSGVRRWLTVTTARWKIESAGILKYWRDPTVEKIYIPFACTCAVLAGSIGIGLGLETLFYSWLTAIPKLNATSVWLTTLPAFLIATLMAGRLGLPVASHAFTWAENRNQRRRRERINPWRRRLVGLVPALVITPVMAAAVLAGTPIVRWLGL